LLNFDVIDDRTPAQDLEPGADEFDMPITKFGFAVAALFVLMSVSAFAQDGTNVLVVVNSASPAGQQIAERYAAARGIPADQIALITTVVTEDIEREFFERDIEGPLGAWITRRAAQDRILYIVLTKGVPLRIRGGKGMGASVDSELTLLYRKLLGNPTQALGRVDNPYFQADRPLSQAQRFSHAAHDIYLVTRLDGFSVADVHQLIDRSVKPAKEGQILLDQRAQTFSDRTGDTWLAAAAKQLQSLGLDGRTVLDSSREVLADRKQVLGYYSWGSNDSAIKRRRFNFAFAPGALAAMFVSTDARTFKEPPDTWSIGRWTDTRTFYEGSPQSLTGDLIREGATGVAGHVAEPFLDAAIRPQVLFPAYFSGYNLAESFYLAMPYLSWQTVIIGDPLCSPFEGQNGKAVALPVVDSRTQLPAFFSTRRIAFLVDGGVPQAAAELLVKGEARLAAGDREGGRAALEAATEIDERLTRAHITLADMYEGAGEHDKAITRYRAILATIPNHIRSLNNLAYALSVHKGAYAEALPIAQRAQTLDPGNSSITDTLGWIHFLMGNFTEAERVLTQAANEPPPNAEVHVHLAHLYAKTARPEMADSAIRRAVEMQPDLKTRKDVAELLSKTGNR
jgi:uncharacterized protein (TIGR03790 family)